MSATHCDICGMDWTHHGTACVAGHQRPERSFAPASGSARASVRLKISDWEDLVNFVNGDLANMPYEDPVGTQMRGILDAIRLSIVKAQNKQI